MADSTTNQSNPGGTAQPNPSGPAQSAVTPPDLDAKLKALNEGIARLQALEAKLDERARSVLKPGEPGPGKIKEHYPEIFEQPDGGEATDEQVHARELRNFKHRLLYQAVRYLLKNNFEVADDIPAEPEAFPGDLDDGQKARFLAVYGMLLADNYDDPMMGKIRPGPDDETDTHIKYRPLPTSDDSGAALTLAKKNGDLALVVKKPEAKDHPELELFLARPFINAVVSAVKEYTANPELFKKALAFLKTAGLADAKTKPSKRRDEPKPAAQK